VAWIVGIDEAGYGPNLGPLVMSAVACQVGPRRARGNLWQLLADAVRSGREEKDDRLLVDDSKVVYAAGRGLAELERSVLGALWRGDGLGTLAGFVGRVCPGGLAELQAEVWYRGTSILPGDLGADELIPPAERFDGACHLAGVTNWRVHSVVVCPARFNALIDRHASKGAVLADAMAHLLACSRATLPGDDPLFVYVDKHGGRNAYAAQLQDALPGGMVLALHEGAERSTYKAVGLERPVQVQFEPRADSSHFCVALASMASKYLRERLMGEFNHFWQTHVPGLAPTAGYPGDALRFYQAITPVARRLGVPEAALWRRK
jgi:ribonuclease HII